MGRLYEYIKGIIDSVSPDYIVVENGGIGYRLLAPNPYIFSKSIGQERKIFTYQHVREDLIALYGFETAEERALFQKLLNVSGIGPKGALAILAYGQPQQVVDAIENENESFLVKFPGVGKKTARQMILDLKGKLQGLVPEMPDEAGGEKAVPASTNQNLEEAMLALAALGYSEKEIAKVVPELPEEVLSADEYIKLALKAMVK